MSDHDQFDGFEEQLHDMLQERGSQPVATPHAPPDVLRRTRRRQVSTALVSGITAVAVIGGAILGVQAVGRGGSQRPVAGDTGSSGSTRTVTLDGYTITYPYDWALQRAMGGWTAYVNPGGPMIPGPTPTSGIEQPDSTTGVAVSGPTGVSGPSSVSGAGGVSGPSTVTGTSGVTSLTGPPTPTGPTGQGGVAGGDTAIRGKGILAAVGGPYLQLSNLYPDHVLDLTCDGTDFPSSEVALQVTVQRIEDGSGDSSSGQGTSCPDGSTVSTASHEANGGGQLAFVMYARVGSGVSDTDRQALFAAYDSIDYPIVPQGLPMGGGAVGSTGSGGAAEGDGSNTVTPPHAVDSVSTVVAGGTTPSGSSWVMLTDPSGTSMQVEVGNMGFGWASASAPGQEPSEPDLDASVQTAAANSPPIVVGSVVGSAARVEVRPDGGDPIDVPLLAAPAVTGIERSYFLTELPDLGSSSKGTLVALDPDGNVIARQDFDSSGGSIEPACPMTQGGANDDPADCPPMPACPSTAPGDKGSVKECIVCREVLAEIGRASCRERV